MVRHRDDSSIPPFVTVAVPAAIGLILLGLWAAFVWPFGGGSRSGPRTQVGAAGSPSGSPSASPSGSPANSAAGAGAGAGSSAEVAAAWRRCDQEMRAATATVAAGQVAATHWSRHIGAQVRFDRGEITAEQAKAIWKASKLPGPQDLSRFTAARTGYERVRGACEAVPAAETGRKACAERSARARAAVAAATRVVDDWAEHQKMMAQQDHSTTAYLARWAGMVRAAPVNLDAFQAERVRVQRAAACQIPG